MTNLTCNLLLVDVEKNFEDIRLNAPRLSKNNGNLNFLKSFMYNCIHIFKKNIMKSMYFTHWSHKEGYVKHQRYSIDICLWIFLEKKTRGSVSLTFHFVFRKLYTEPSIGDSYQISINLAKWFRRKKLLIGLSKTRTGKLVVSPPKIHQIISPEQLYWNSGNKFMITKITHFKPD